MMEYVLSLGYRYMIERGPLCSTFELELIPRNRTIKTEDDVVPR
jgi:hypothetical protein